MPPGAKQGAETGDWSWVEASIWTERMVSALVNGVEGGKWYSLLRKQEKRPGIGRCLADQQRWPNVFFADAGLFAFYPAWQTARHSR
jgi:hypothetical protein